MIIIPMIIADYVDYYLQSSPKFHPLENAEASMDSRRFGETVSNARVAVYLVPRSLQVLVDDITPSQEFVINNGVVVADCLVYMVIYHDFHGRFLSNG